MALGGLTFFLFAPAIAFHFVRYDDDLYVYQNPHVLGGLTLAGLKYAFTTFDVGSWMPLTWLSLQWDATWSGAGPAGYHFTNILLHAISAGLLFMVLARMSKSFWRSALATALFAFHPLRQESVVWIAERKDVLSTFFWVLGLLAYLRYVERPCVKTYLMLTVCLLCGLAAKPMLITFPATLLLLDYWPLRRFEPATFVTGWRLLREKLPLFGLGIAMATVTVWSQQQVHAVGHAPTDLTQKTFHVLNNYGFYARKFFWPESLAVIYSAAPRDWFTSLIGAAIFGLTSVAAFCARKRFPWFFMGWGWFLITLLPVIGLLQLGHIFVADRYTYIPSIGLAILVAWGLGSMVDNLPKTRALVVGAGILICITLATVNHVTLVRWTDSVTLFTDSVAKSAHPVACNNLANALVERGDFDAAVRYATLGIQLDDQKPGAFNARGLAFNAKGNFAAAIADYTAALVRDTNFAEAWNNRGSAYASAGDSAAALADFAVAVALKPDFVEAWNNRTIIFFSQSNYLAALTNCTQAIALAPASEQAYVRRGYIRSRLGNHADAVADFSRALELNPTLLSAYEGRVSEFSELNDFARARTDIERIIQLGGKPDPQLEKKLSPGSGGN